MSNTISNEIKKLEERRRNQQLSIEKRQEKEYNENPQLYLKKKYKEQEDRIESLENVVFQLIRITEELSGDKIEL